MKTLPDQLPDDPALLKELIVKLAHQVNEKEQQINDQTRSQVAEQNKHLREIDRLQAKLSWFEELLKLATFRQFGPSSEKHPAQDDLFNEAEAHIEEIRPAIDETQVDAAPEVQASKPRKPKRQPLPKNLPRERVEHDLPEDQKVCTCCGGKLHQIGEEISEQLDIIPAQIHVKEHVRLKYGCRGCEDGVTTAKAPKQPMPGSLASPGTLAYVVTAKYCDAMPLYRQSEMFARGNIKLSRSTLSDWMVKAGHILKPLYQAMHRQLLSEPVLHADETTVQVLKEPGRAAQSKSYMWLYRTGADSPQPIVLFDYQPGRGQVYPKAFLDGYAGYLQVDGYQAYNNLCDVIPVGCWAHARRKFDEALKLLPKEKQRSGGKAMQALSTIQKLYRVETLAKDKTADERYQLRQEQAKPLLERFKTWLEKCHATGLPKSKMGDAISYCLNQWPKLVRYVEDGRLSIDNNIAERDIRPFAMGRKNWMFSNTPRGAESSAVLYSLVLTARANGLNQYRYLKALFEQLPNLEGDDLSSLMPWNIKIDAPDVEKQKPATDL